MNWENDGYELLNMKGNGYKVGSTNHNLDHIFVPAITWTKVTSGMNGFRVAGPGFLYDDASGLCPIATEAQAQLVLGLLNSPVTNYAIQALNPTLNLNPGNLCDVPVDNRLVERVSLRGCITRSTDDWNAYERSWDFTILPILASSSEKSSSLESIYAFWITQNSATIAEMKRLEEENNRLFIDAYGLADELTPDVPIEQITLTVNPAYRYGGKLTEEELWIRFRQDTMQELVSYALGCMMGRYSLDAPGLIYAHSGNEGFDPSRYPTFPADADGIIPVTDDAWFGDDATIRFAEFIAKAWPADGLEDNLAFVANALGAKANESSRDAIRRYFADDFYKDHCQTYKKRPIYWLFSSGKQRAFQCLVYLHRYNADTLGRMRADYIIPLQGKLQGRLTALTEEVARAVSTAQRKQAQKTLDLIDKKIRELAAFDDQLRSYADKRIKLNLDDGVKVNIQKFGALIDLKPLGNLDSEE